MGPKPAIDDYPIIKKLKTTRALELGSLGAEILRAMEEIDALRISVACYESHVCEHSYE